MLAGCATALDAVVRRLAAAESLDGANEAIAAFSRRLGGPKVPAHVHPTVVWAPLAAWGSAAVFDLIDDEPAAETMVGLGVLVALPALFTGHEDWMHADTRTRRVATVHAALNNVVTGAYAASWLSRRHGHRRAGVVSALGGGLLLLGSAALGVRFAHPRGRWTYGPFEPGDR